MTYGHTIRKMAQSFALADADVALYAAKVTVWGRWSSSLCPSSEAGPPSACNSPRPTRTSNRLMRLTCPG